MTEAPMIPPHIVAAAVAEVEKTAAGVLSEDERAAIVVGIDRPEDGPVSLVVRGPEELVDRIERALYPDRGPDGPAPAASAARDVRSQD